jgi:hypothetical protein
VEASHPDWHDETGMTNTTASRLGGLTFVALFVPSACGPNAVSSSGDGPQASDSDYDGDGRATWITRSSETDQYQANEVVPCEG